MAPARSRAADATVELQLPHAPVRERQLVAPQKLDQPHPATRCGIGSQAPRLLELAVVDLAKRRVGEEVIAAQARVRVWTCLDQRQAAIAVRERLLGAGDPLLHPRSL